MAFTRQKLYAGAITNPRTSSSANVSYGLQEGRFQATIVATSGWTGNPNFVEFQWFRCENTVSCTGSVQNFIPGIVPVDNIIEFTLPITPIDDLNKDRINGNCVGCRANSVDGNGCISQGIVSAKNALLLYNTNTALGGQKIEFHFKYQITNLV